MNRTGQNMNLRTWTGLDSSRQDMNRARYEQDRKTGQDMI